MKTKIKPLDMSMYIMHVCSRNTEDYFGTSAFNTRFPRVLSVLRFRPLAALQPHTNCFPQAPRVLLPAAPRTDSTAVPRQPRLHRADKVDSNSPQMGPKTQTRKSARCWQCPPARQS